MTSAIKLIYGKKRYFLFHNRFLNGQGRKYLWNNFKGIQTRISPPAAEQKSCGISGIISDRHSNRIKNEKRAVLAKCRSTLPSQKELRIKDFMTRVCIEKHENFYEEHLGKSRVYPARVVCPNRSCFMKLQLGKTIV